MQIIKYKNTKISFQNKTIVIINTNNNIGKTLANFFVQKNSKIILLDNNIKQENDYNINNKYNSNLSIYPINLLKYQYHDYLILSNVIKKKYKNINNIIINKMEPNIIKPLTQYQTNDWHNTIQNNLNSTFLLLKTLIPILDIKKNPSITLTLQPQNKIALSFFGAYSCSDAALYTLMNILNNENDNIRVNGIFIENINTYTKKHIYPYETKKNLKNITDVINGYAFLMCNKYKNIKNKIISPITNYKIKII